ncbi:MAG: 4Fe-4S dicluster domain-containing protein [Chloroflexi bacterium]|nr:4Fe-4S dicluster domain-containing protein [Chloroflexota bacterium]
MKRIYPREEVCIGCRLCEIHCLVQHSRSKNLIKAYKKESPRGIARISVQEDGPVSFALQCRHCEEPLCVYSCLTGAMYRDPETGAVRHDAEKCVGCWTCILACPYGAIARDLGARKIVAKCDLCPGLAVPACVANCPNEALIYREEAS